MKLDIQLIKSILPHRYPFLLIDRITHLDVENETVEAVKNVTVNEPFFNGHFPEEPIMPGVLIVEAMAQAMAVLGEKLIQAQLGDAAKDKIFVLAGIDKVRIRKSVVPGDVMTLKASIGKHKGPLFWSTAEAIVDGECVCKAELMAAHRDK